MSCNWQYAYHKQFMIQVVRLVVKRLAQPSIANFRENIVIQFDARFIGRDQMQLYSTLFVKMQQ